MDEFIEASKQFISVLSKPGYDIEKCTLLVQYSGKPYAIGFSNTGALVFELQVKEDTKTAETNTEGDN